MALPLARFPLILRLVGRVASEWHQQPAQHDAAPVYKSPEHTPSLHRRAVQGQYILTKADLAPLLALFGAGAGN